MSPDRCVKPPQPSEAWHYDDTHTVVVGSMFSKTGEKKKKTSKDVQSYRKGAERCPRCVYRQLNLLSTATPAIGAWLVPIDQLKSSLRKLDMEGTLRVCAVMGCIMTEALEVSASTGCRPTHVKKSIPSFPVAS